MWFDDWSSIMRVVAVGAAAYGTLIVTLRVSGKRTLAKLNAFDFVVTVAVGSTLATSLLGSGVSYVDSVAALVLLVLLQFVVSWLSTHVPGTSWLVTARPTLLVRHGDMRHSAMRSQRISEAEIRQAVRRQGHGDLSRIGAVVLETDGTLSTVPSSTLGDGSALLDVDEGRAGSPG